MNRMLLRLLFGSILISLLLVTSYAALQQPVWQWSGLKERPNNWWTIATLLDAYYGFITFYVWVLYKEQRFGSRLLWFIAIMLLGNMAMSAYLLRELARLGPTDSMARLLTAHNP